MKGKPFDVRPKKNINSLLSNKSATQKETEKKLLSTFPHLIELLVVTVRSKRIWYQLVLAFLALLKNRFHSSQSFKNGKLTPIDWAPYKLRCAGSTAASFHCERSAETWAAPEGNIFSWRSWNPGSWKWWKISHFLQAVVSRTDSSYVARAKIYVNSSDVHLNHLFNHWFNKLV